MQQPDEEALTEAIIQLASEYGRYGYRRITALLQEAGWSVGKDRVQRIWRREGLKVPQTKAARKVVVQRWLMHPTPASACESCLELRFCERQDARQKNDPDADADR
jgi:transposase InsO family protein